MLALTRTRRPASLFSPFEELFADFAPANTNWAPALDFVESEDAYRVTFDLPGVEPAELDISVVDDRLEIKGEKKSEAKKEGEGWHRVERRYGSFSRAIQLPGAVDTEKVVAESKNGVLTVTLPKLEAARARKVDVKVS